MEAVCGKREETVLRSRVDLVGSREAWVGVGCSRRPFLDRLLLRDAQLDCKRPSM